MNLIKPTNFYNEGTLNAIADNYSDTDVEHQIVVSNLKHKIQTICFTDVDGTYINTGAALKFAQSDALAKVANVSFEEAYDKLQSKGLKAAVEQYMSLNDFFKGSYKTFDPKKAVKDGLMSVFPDALAFTESGIPTVAISNSSELATRAKLNALGIEDVFVGIYAEYLSETAKPNIYLAEKAIKDLDDKGWYNSNQLLIHVGDQEYDVQFANNIKKIHSNTLNVLIERDKPYTGSSKPDIVIKSFAKLYAL